MSANSYRLNSRERASQQMEKSKPANVRRHPVVQQHHQVKRFKGWLAALILLPLGLITTMTLGELLFRALTRLDFWRSEQFLFFTLGGVAWGMAHVIGWRPMHLYVLSHELSHLIVARAFGGKIISWKVTAQGGYVELVFGLVGMFWHLQEVRSISIGSHVVNLRPVWIFYVLLGLTWWFHITYTLKTVFIHQSDLERNGEFFSMALIFLINIALIVLLFLAASPAPGFGLLEVGRCWLGMADWLMDLVLGRFW